MTETDTLTINTMAQNRRDTSYPRPFVGTLFQDLMERSGTELGTRGCTVSPMPTCCTSCACAGPGG